MQVRQQVLDAVDGNDQKVLSSALAQIARLEAVKP